MKKRIFIILALVLVITGCSKVPEEELIEIDPEETVGEENMEEMIEDNIKNIEELEVGKPAIDFTLKNLSGDEISLSDYKDKIVLINFWATWCPWCDKEMPDLQKLDDENDDLVVLAVDVMEDKSKVEKYIKEGKYKFEVLLDESGEVAMSYLAGSLPMSYFVDKDGNFLGLVQGAMTYEQMNMVLDDIREPEQNSDTE